MVWYARRKLIDGTFELVGTLEETFAIRNYETSDQIPALMDEIQYELDEVVSKRYLVADKDS